MPKRGGADDGPIADELGLTIDSSSFVPYYVQIMDHVRELIKKNKLKQGQTFCSEGERDLAHLR